MQWHWLKVREKGGNWGQQPLPHFYFPLYIPLLYLPQIVVPFPLLTIAWMQWHWLSILVERERERERARGKWGRQPPPICICICVFYPIVFPFSLLQWHWLSFLVQRVREKESRGEVGAAASTPFGLRKKKTTPLTIMPFFPCCFTFLFSGFGLSGQTLSKGFCQYPDSYKTWNFWIKKKGGVSEHPARAFLAQLPSFRIPIKITPTPKNPTFSSQLHTL